MKNSTQGIVIIALAALIFESGKFIAAYGSEVLGNLTVIFAGVILIIGFIRAFKKDK